MFMKSFSCYRSDDGLWSEDASDLFDELSQASCWVPVMAKVRGYRLQARGDRGNSPVPMLEIISNVSPYI
jgi:hypothetical protein